MGVGDLPLPVDSATETNNPVPRSGDDDHNDVNDRLKVLERVGSAELARQIKWLYENAAGGPYPYPPP